MDTARLPRGTKQHLWLNDPSCCSFHLKQVQKLPVSVLDWRVKVSIKSSNGRSPSKLAHRTLAKSWRLLLN